MSSVPSLRVFQCDLQISSSDLGLTRDKYTKALLRDRIRNNIARMGWRNAGTHTINRPFQDIIDDFAEKSAPGAIANLRSYFTRRFIGGYTAGGRRATSRALLYTRNQLRPGGSDIGAVGEGVAGYYLESIEGLVFEIRPFDVSPDLIFRDPSTGDLILAEVKSSLETPVRNIVTVAISLIDILAKTKFIRKGRYMVYVIAVKIKNLNDFELQRLKLEEI